MSKPVPGTVYVAAVLAYSWDVRDRYVWHDQHYATQAEAEKILADAREAQKPVDSSGFSGYDWVRTHMDLHGFIERCDGIYKITTERVG